MNQDWLNALAGGVLIGISVSLMLMWNGRVTGISGIINGALTPVKGDAQWRWFFILGLLFGGIVLKQINPHVFENTVKAEIWTTVLAGLLVGFGTIMGSGCTSGHGVCGISRMSLRSLVATVVFMLAGIGTVYLFRLFGATL